MLDIIDWRIDCRCLENCLYCCGCTNTTLLNETEEYTILDKIVHSHINVVNLTGGEPMYNSERCVRIINYLSNANKLVYLSTNGYHFDRYADQLISMVAFIGLPLDGYNENTNSLNGRSTGSFSQILRILHRPDISNCKIKIGTVVTQKNIDKELLFRLSELLDQLPISVWRLYEMIPENRGKKNKSTLILSHDQLQLLQETVEEIKTRPHNYKIELATRNMRTSNYLIIQPNGKAIIPVDYGDHADDIIIGDLVNQPLIQIEKRWGDISRKFSDPSYRANRLTDIRNQL